MGNILFIPESILRFSSNQGDMMTFWQMYLSVSIIESKSGSAVTHLILAFKPLKIS